MKTQRFDALDALRGFAMVWMTAFHFCFDLNHFGYWSQDFRVDPVWTWQRTVILSLFLLTAGAGQAIAIQQGQTWRRFWQRWRWVAGSALLVSAGSYLMYPSTFIYFGVLHGMAVMLIVMRVTAGWGASLWLLGLMAIATKFISENILLTGTSAVLFNSTALNWLGLVTRKPVTEDYVPILPWVGVMWWGMAAGTWVLSHRMNWLVFRDESSAADQDVKLSKNQQTGPVFLRILGTLLAKLGRFSLIYYLIHQPVMIGILIAFGWFAR